MALPINPTEDSSSPYYLHPSDLYETLTGENFVAWKKSVSMAMAVKNKMGFLDGSIEQPNPDNSMYSCWYRINALLLSWLIYSISPTLRTTFLSFTNAKELWDEIQLRYGKSDGPRLFQLEKTLGNLSQGSRSITDYYNSFKEIWDEYCTFRIIPSCTCGHCTCKISETYQKIIQKESILKFLVGLNESYSNLRSQILLNTDNTTLSSIYSILLQEESQRSLQNSISFSTSFSEPSASEKLNNDATAFFVKNFKKKNSIICNHCGYQGHSSEKCFQLIGYPNNWKGPKGQRLAPGFKPNPNSNKNHHANLAANSTEPVLTPTHYTESAPTSTNSNSATTDLCDPNLYEKFLQFIQAQQPKTASVNAVTIASDDGLNASDNASQFLGPPYQQNDWLC
ncbi:unnamed protein product [Cuscuta epithymum]|uniref:Retrotransposon Copia-like N-terminal domain-containing protein n=1 Tax=Cuscuta epithymum TaxID=186058 RepID=A0AAV0FEN5_9ASTE|nr:unnamed protein product [Cuscuta epithymum]